MVAAGMNQAGVNPAGREQRMAVAGRGVWAHTTPEPDIPPVPEQEPFQPEVPQVDPDPSEVPPINPVPVQDPIPHQVPIRA